MTTEIHRKPLCLLRRGCSTWLGLLLLTGLAASGNVALAAGGSELLSVDINVKDTAALQRGVRVFNDYCLGCHGADYMRYKRIADDLGFEEDQVEAKLLPPGREMADALKSAITAEDAQQLFGAVPPNLSLSARSRGADWLYSYMLTFYPDATTKSGWNNLVFPNAAMPHAMWELQGIQLQVDEHAAADIEAAQGHADITDGLELVTAGQQSPEDYRETVKDLVTFMVYLSEPAQLKRAAIGPWAILFLVLFSVIAYMLKKEYWRDVH